jgi:IPT/TIG domain-containing protein/lectin family protein/putative Ig domain-containing protein
MKRANFSWLLMAIAIWMAVCGVAQQSSQAAPNQTSSGSPNYGGGFTTSGLTLNGGATISGARLQLTDGAGGEARSAFFSTPVNVESFTNDFSFQLTNAEADGFTFTIQGEGARAVGKGGGNLGYGGIGRSAAVKFDLYSNEGEGTDSTGLFTNGVFPGLPASDMTASDVDLHSGDVMNVHMTYDGKTLTWTISDARAGTHFEKSATVNIPSLVGADTAYVGFTGGTGGLTAKQDILTWSYVSGAAAPATSAIEPSSANLPQITTNALPAGAVRVAYGATLKATKGVPPYKWGVASGQLPSGLSLQASTGQIVGTPSQAGTFSFSIEVRDSDSQNAQAGFSENIAPASSPVISSMSPSSGPTSGGTAVTISGSNFQAGATVTFGGVEASSVTVFSSSQIRALTPGHIAGNVDVIVQANGQSSSSSADFTYSALTPAISSVSPNSGPTAGGTTVTISGSNFLAGALVLFGTVPAPGVAVASGGQIRVITPAGIAGAVSVTVENPGNLASRLANAFLYISSSAGPAVVTGITPSSGPVGTQVTITGTNFESGATVAFGSTSATPVVVSSSTQLVTSVPAVNAGTYSVTVTDPDPSSATLPKGFTVTASPAETLSGNQSLLPGLTPETLRVPAGWTLATTQDFEASALPSGQAINAGASISCSFSHSGSCSESSVISFDGAAAQWYFSQGQLTGREFYLSFWDYAKGALFNTEYVLGHIIKTGIGSAGCGGANNLVPCPGAGQEELGLDTLVGDYCGVFNCASPPSVTGMQGNFISASNTQFNGSTATDYGSTGWNQWEFWFKANTPGASDGFERVYLNGRLFNDYENVSFFGNVDMTGMQVEAGGWYTKNVWTSNGQAPPAGKCSSAPGYGQEVTGSNGGKSFAFYGSQCAPTAPTFTRYIDDIILLEK